MAPFLGKFGGWRENGLTPTATPKLLYDHPPLEDFDKLSVMDGGSPISIPRPQKSFQHTVTAADSFVHSMLAKAETRKSISQLLKECCLVEGGDLQINSFLRDEGFETTLPAVIQALDNIRSNDLLFWVGRYNLFVLWSADRQHPWDTLPTSEGFVTLEIGKQHGVPLLLLNSRPIERFEFDNCVLRTTSPVDWQTPSGAIAKVNLELQMGSFFGYGNDHSSDGSYFGIQCHGVLWPAATATLPSQWPIAPPLIAGKVNIRARDAAVSPFRSDSLTAFSGSYRTHVLPDSPGHPSKPSVLLEISQSAKGPPTVSLDGKIITNWTFEANNVLSWADPCYQAWLQFLVFPGGPVFLGNLLKTGEPAPSRAGYNIFGELKKQASRLGPDSTVDASVGRMIAAGVSTAATLLCGNLLKSASKTLSLLKSGSSADEVLQSHGGLLTQMQTDFATLARLHLIGAKAEATFPESFNGYEVNPNLSADAVKGQEEAAEGAQAAKVAADAAATAAEETEEAWHENNAMEATSKAGVAAWRASQAASAAASAEACALEAARHARIANTVGALSAAISAAQSFNLAKEAAYDAAKAEARAASAALRAVEQGIAWYAERREYLKLKDIAEASDVAGKALNAAKEAVEGWEGGSVASRLAACEAAKEAAEHAQLCHKFMRAVAKT
eukprot:jgi/Botrbrau1/18099/Bobra.0687s0001.1